MMRRLLLLFGPAALAAALSGPVAAQEYSYGGTCQKGRGPATLSPVEAYGVHPPGIDPADAKRCCRRWRRVFVPYYAPVAPVATSARWEPWCYFPLMPYYTPYYCGYCPKRLHNPPPQPYGTDGWGKGPMPDPNMPIPAGAPLKYGVYTSVLQDDTLFWNMGGNGLVPYGAPRPPHEGPPDLVDMIQTRRAGGGPGACGGPPLDGAAPIAVEAPPAPPEAEKPAEEKPRRKKSAEKKPTEMKPAEDSPELSATPE